MEPQHIDLLRQEVVKSFGRRILSSNDCHYLSYDISRRLRITLSFNTLRRFFNIMKATTQPSIYTLNTLSVYCGFSSFDNFITSNQQSAVATNDCDSCLLRYLIVLFRDTELRDNNDATFNTLVQHTIQFLNNYPHLADAFQREIAKTKNGQTYYFEKFINIDKLNSIYGQGLQYYAVAKETKAAQIFAHSLLCFRSFLVNDNAGVEVHYKTVMQYDTDSTAISLFVLSHFFATQLYCAFVRKKDPEAILVKARKLYSTIVFSKEQSHLFFYFEMVMSNALILTGNFEEAMFYIEEGLKKKKKNLQSFIEVLLPEGLEVYQAIALYHTGKEAAARNAFEQVNTGKFYALSKQYFTILYLYIKQCIRKNSSEQEQLQYLVQETGFERLLTLTNKPVPLATKLV